MPILGSIIKKAFELRNLPVEKQRQKQNPVVAQKKELVKLLRKAQFTAIGEHYKFSNLITSNDVQKSFEETVPVHDYQTNV